jgi:hypothetical protein
VIAPVEHLVCTDPHTDWCGIGALQFDLANIKQGQRWQFARGGRRSAIMVAID